MTVNSHFTSSVVVFKERKIEPTLNDLWAPREGKSRFPGGGWGNER